MTRAPSCLWRLFPLALALALGPGCGRDTREGLLPAPEPAAAGPVPIAADPGWVDAAAETGIAPGDGMFPDVRDILGRGVLRVGIYGTNEPFVIRGPGGALAGGLDIELATGLARRLGVRPEFDLASSGYGELFRRLQAGELDLAVGGLSRTFGRARSVYFSRPYVRLNQALIMRRTDLLRLRIERNPLVHLKTAACAIGVVAGSSFLEYAQHQFPKAALRPCAGWQEALQTLDRGEVLAVLDDNNTVALMACRHPEIALDLTAFILTNMPDRLAVAVSPLNPNLVTCVNLHLESRALDLDLKALMRRYPGVYRGD